MSSGEGISTTRTAQNVPSAIIDAAIISLIVDPANWNVDGEYTGSIAGMKINQYYTDVSNKTKYEFTGVTVVRIMINTQS